MLIKSALKFFLGGCAFGFAFGSMRYFDQWLHFPAFPNVLDSIGMALIGTCLMYESLKPTKDPFGFIPEVSDIETQHSPEVTRASKVQFI